MTQVDDIPTTLLRTLASVCLEEIDMQACSLQGLEVLAGWHGITAT